MSGHQISPQDLREAARHLMGEPVERAFLWLPIAIGCAIPFTLALVSEWPVWTIPSAFFLACFGIGNWMMAIGRLEQQTKALTQMREAFLVQRALKDNR